MSGAVQSSTVAMLDALFADLPADVVLAFSAVEPGAEWQSGPRYGHRFFAPAEIDDSAAWCASWGPGRNVYVRCMPMLARPARRGDAVDSKVLVGLWADLDFDVPGHKPSPSGLPHPATVDDARRVLEAVGITPTFVLHTGGGLQPWWLLDEPVIARDEDERAQLESFVKRWGTTMVEHGKRLGVHVDYVGDASRVLRVAGTWRTKPVGDTFTAPMRVRLVEVGGQDPDDMTRIPTAMPAGIATARPWRPGLRYGLDELGAAIIEPPVEPAATAPSATRTPTRDTSHGYGPADAFAKLAWSAILEPAGWTFVGHEHGRIELWRRPGDPSSEYSLKAGFADGASAVVWSSNCGLPVGKGQRLTKWRLWCLLHNLDEATAARLVRKHANERAVMA